MGDGEGGKEEDEGAAGAVDGQGCLAVGPAMARILHIVGAPAPGASVTHWRVEARVTFKEIRS